MRRVLALAVAWGLLIGAAPRPLEPPLPDLTRLVPFAQAPSEKPAVVIDLPLPRPPVDLPAFPSAVPTPPAADKPTAFIQSPRALPCVGSWLGIATESLECGRARFQRGDFEDAYKAFENAVQSAAKRTGRLCTPESSEPRLYFDLEANDGETLCLTLPHPKGQPYRVVVWTDYRDIGLNARVASHAHHDPPSTIAVCSNEKSRTDAGVADTWPLGDAHARSDRSIWMYVPWNRLAAP